MKQITIHIYSTKRNECYPALEPLWLSYYAQEKGVEIRNKTFFAVRILNNAMKEQTYCCVTVQVQQTAQADLGSVRIKKVLDSDGWQVSWSVHSLPPSLYSCCGCSLAKTPKPPKQEKLSSKKVEMEKVGINIRLDPRGQILLCRMPAVNPLLLSNGCRLA